MNKYFKMCAPALLALSLVHVEQTKQRKQHQQLIQQRQVQQNHRQSKLNQRRPSRT